jgi:hypothetical protein
MNSLAISAAPFENNQELENHHNLYTNESGPAVLSNFKKNKTVKNQNNHSKSVKKMQAMALNAYNQNSMMDDNNSMEDNDGEELANFSPIENESKANNSPSSGDPLANQTQKYYSKPVTNELTGENAVSSIRSYNNLPSTSTDEYYKRFQPSNAGSINNEILLRKLDSILELLEEQSDEKTNYIMEELILYLFLGIFVIFVIDSFVRVGKYVR